MHPFYRATRGTQLEEHQIGTIVLKDNSGVLETKDELGNYKRFRASDPIDDQDVVTKKSVSSVPAIRHHMITDFIENIGKNATKDGALSEATLKDNGEVIGIAAYVETARTGGTASFYATINGTTQNGSGQYCTIDASNSRRVYQEISPAIQYGAGQSIGIRSVTSGYAPNNTRAVVTLYLRDR